MSAHIRQAGRTLLWCLGAAFTAAATAYAGWLLMAIASLYASGGLVETSQLDSKTKNERTQVSELAALLASYPAQALAPPPRPDEFMEPTQVLSRAEVREVQQRLTGLGFDPGRVDGSAGKRTEQAARRYLNSRDAVETAAVDRRVLDKLRADPVPLLPPAAPKVASVARPKPINPVLASIKAASDRLGRFLNSI